MGCYNSCVVDATPGRVWAALRNFHDLSWAPDVVQTVERVGAPAGVREFCDPIYRALLDSLKQHFAPSR